jgi:hypothetical protein
MESVTLIFNILCLVFYPYFLSPYFPSLPQRSSTSTGLSFFLYLSVYIINFYLPELLQGNFFLFLNTIISYPATKWMFYSFWEKNKFYLTVFSELPVLAGSCLVGWSSPRLLGGGPPLCIGKQEVGTYIYSLLYTHTGLLWRLHMKFYSC